MTPPSAAALALALWATLRFGYLALAQHRWKRFLKLEKRYGGLQAGNTVDLLTVIQFVAPGVKLKKQGNRVYFVAPWWWWGLGLVGRMKDRANTAGHIVSPPPENQQLN